MTYNSVTAIVLTKDEEKNLLRCLGSLTWCADTVVVDSGSSDGTAATARQLGARVFSHIPDPPFRIADQRNWALANCKIESKWVLFIDADEEVPAHLAEEISKAINETPFDAFQLTPKYMYHGKWMRHCMAFPNWHDRLLRVGSISFAGGVWEHFVPSVNVSRIQHPYLHHGNSKGLADWVDRHNRYSSWEAEGVYRYLYEGRRVDAFGTNRRVHLRRITSHFRALRPAGRFIWMYLIRGGFRDGRAALGFCVRYGLYEYLIQGKVQELRRERQGLPL